jgi:hypothetical protein
MIRRGTPKFFSEAIIFSFIIVFSLSTMKICDPAHIIGAPRLSRMENNPSVQPPDFFLCRI